MRTAIGERIVVDQSTSGVKLKYPASGVMMIPIPRAGILGGVEGLEAARNSSGIDGVTINIPPGQKLIPVPEGNKYLGFIFAHGNTSGQVEAYLRNAHSLLEFMIEP